VESFPFSLDFSRISEDSVNLSQLSGNIYRKHSIEKFVTPGILAVRTEFIICYTQLTKITDIFLVLLILGVTSYIEVRILDDNIQRSCRSADFFKLTLKINDRNEIQ
jgi:hypothetical protein